MVSRTTTVRITSPITSSATAAPSTVRASTIVNALRSPKTRAVIPTLVAVMAAPTKSASFPDMPMICPNVTPPMNGSATPRIATLSDALPTAVSSLSSSSDPTSRSSRMTPISARTRSTSLLSTRSSADGPMRMPARISPTTAGTLMRSINSAATFAATSTIRMSSSAWPTTGGLRDLDTVVAGAHEHRPPHRRERWDQTTSRDWLLLRQVELGVGDDTHLDVGAGELLVLGDPDAALGQGVLDLEEGERDAADDEDDRRRADHLAEELLETVRGVVEDAGHAGVRLAGGVRLRDGAAGRQVPASAVLPVGEDPDAQHTEDAADAVDRDGADRIVDTATLPQADRLDHDDCGNRADHRRRPRLDEGARSRDRDQTGEHAVRHHPGIGLARTAS